MIQYDVLSITEDIMHNADYDKVPRSLISMNLSI